MSAKLWQYFGPVGTASVVGWLLALVLVAGFFWRRRRTGLYLLALGAAALAVVLARENSDNVREILVDRSAEHEALLQQRRRARAQELRKLASKAADIRYAEDDPAEPLDLAGLTDEERQKLLQTRPASDEREYAYRRRGKQQREEGKRRKVFEDEAALPAGQEAELRMMPEADVIRANRWDVVNRFAARWTLVMCVIAVVLDYLLRFNRTVGSVLPLPIAGRWLDSLFPKTHSVCLAGGQRRQVERLLARAVRKGETFIYFGRCDPWPGDSLPRLPWWLAGWRPLRKITYTPENRPCGSEFVFESAWFGRYCFCVCGAELSAGLLAELMEFLESRRVSRAAAWRTVNVAWDLPETPDADTLERAVFLFKEANFKLIVCCGDRQAEGLAPLFEEVFAAPSPAASK